MEEIEYTIYPDGRIEQIVKGVKGEDCLKLTAEIEEELGEVVSQKPTGEMFEQKVEVEIQEELQNKETWGS